MRKNSIKNTRVNTEVLRELSNILRGGIKDPRVAPLLEQLSHVTQWAEPVKRGRFTYDDREFYESIAKQAASGRILSPRQVAALVKMAAKYETKQEETGK